MNNQAYRNGILYTFTDEEQAEYLASLPTDVDILKSTKEAKCKEIDTATAEAITALVGSEVNQRNLTAKATQLTLKVARDTILTAEEEATLNTLDVLFNQVETLRLSGNDKEAQIQACTTQTEFDTKCIELGV